MMKKLFLAFIFLLSVNVQAQSTSWTNECSARIQGGIDNFPWSVARPFPWADIQGIWKLKDGIVPFYLKTRVIRTTSNRKILSLSVVSEGNCSSPIAQGVGYVDLSEKNVVRAIINDGTSKYQMKLALFDIKDLNIDTVGCEERILAASLQVIGSYPSPNKVSASSLNGTENIMLKKISDDLGSICKKQGNH